MFKEEIRNDIKEDIQAFVGDELNTRREYASSSNVIPEPNLAEGKSKDDYVWTLLNDLFGAMEDVTPEDLHGMMQTLKSSAHKACASFASANNGANALKPWKSLSGMDELAISQLMLEVACRKDHRMDFLSNCVRQWPCIYLIQPKWTNRTKYARVSV